MFLDDGLSLVIEECEKLVEGMEKIKKQQTKDTWKTRVDNLSSNWESCRQNIFETVLSCAEAKTKICSSYLKNESVINCRDCVEQKNLCSMCDEKVHQKYPLHDRDGVYNGYYKAMAPKLSVTCDGQLKTKCMYIVL